MKKESIVKAIQAGLDIFLVAGDNVTIDNAIKMAEFLSEALKGGSMRQYHRRYGASINKKNR